MATKNGLELSEDEFSRMKSNDQMLVLYKNTQEIRSKIGGVQFEQKIQHLMIGALSSIVTYLLYMHIS
jgi:hypothetical protein